VANPSRSVSNTVLVRNRQHTVVVDALLLRAIARTLLVDLLQVDAFELGIYLVAAREMTRLNETFLRHKGSTDVLAFDYSEPSQSHALQGEIFVCVDEARIQATRFRASWQNEVVRYLVHGTLHLLGYDDHLRASRSKMKREENRLLKKLAKDWQLSKLAGPS
jgi:probable rRNA maturation factor